MAPGVRSHPELRLRPRAKARAAPASRQSAVREPHSYSWIVLRSFAMPVTRRRAPTAAFRGSRRRRGTFPRRRGTRRCGRAPRPAPSPARARPRSASVLPLTRRPLRELRPERSDTPAGSPRRKRCDALDPAVDVLVRQQQREAPRAVLERQVLVSGTPCGPRQPPRRRGRARRTRRVVEGHDHEHEVLVNDAARSSSNLSRCSRCSFQPSPVVGEKSSGVPSPSPRAPSGPGARGGARGRRAARGRPGSRGEAGASSSTMHVSTKKQKRMTKVSLRIGNASWPSHDDVERRRWRGRSRSPGRRAGGTGACPTGGRRTSGCRSTRPRPGRA